MCRNNIPVPVLTRIVPLLVIHKINFKKDLLSMKVCFNKIVLLLLIKYTFPPKHVLIFLASIHVKKFDCPHRP